MQNENGMPLPSTGSGHAFSPVFRKVGFSIYRSRRSHPAERSSAASFSFSICERTRFWRTRWLLAIALLWTGFSWAAESATVTFSLDFPNSVPDHYTISVGSDGKAHYSCTAKISDQSDDRDNYSADFTVSDATRAHIFELASQAHYFSGKIDSGNRKLAFTGKKKLVYTDGQKNNTADYNYSLVPAVQQLTTLFQNMGATLEYGRRIIYEHRYQKLALDDELKRMEDEARSGSLAELEAVKPILQQVYDDPSVMNIARARALRIMDMGNMASGAH
jgi:hypothetical protein